jgi:hypothetical protein
VEKRVIEAGQICGSILARFYRKGLADFSKFYFSLIFLKGRNNVFLLECNEFSMLGFTLLLSALSSPGWQPSSACFSPAKPFR